MSPLTTTRMARIKIMPTFLVLGIRFGTTLVNHPHIIVQDGRNHRHHIRFHNACAYILAAADTDVDDALEGEVPLPAFHHVLGSAAFLQDADQTLDTAIDGEDVSYAGGGSGEVCEVVEGVYEGESGCAVESSSVVEGGGDAHAGLVGVGDAEVDFAHCVVCLVRRGRAVAGPVVGMGVYAELGRPCSDVLYVLAITL